MFCLDVQVEGQVFLFLICLTNGLKKSLLMFAACWMFLIPFGNLPLLHCDFIDFLNVTFFRWFLESWYCWKNGSLLHG